MSIKLRTPRNGEDDSSVDIMELSIEGILEVDTEDARAFMSLVLNSPLAAHMVIRLSEGEWVKLDSRWGSAARHSVFDSRTSLSHAHCQKLMDEVTARKQLS